jgi:hypothetical protein
MRCVQDEMEHVQGVGEDMHLVHILQTNIIGLTDPICDCSQFGVIRGSKTSSRPVIVEVPLMPEVENCN